MSKHPSISSVYQNVGAERFDVRLEKVRRIEAAKKRNKRLEKAERKHLAPGIAAGPVRSWSATNPRGGSKVVRANYLREHPTNSEGIMLEELRKYPGWGFSASQHLYGYIADFYSRRFDLVVELDGWSHKGREKADADRDRHLLRRGIRTLRFPSSMAFTDLQGIVGSIRSFIESHVTMNESVASGDSPSRASRQDVNLKPSAGLIPVNNGIMSGARWPVA